MQRTPEAPEVETDRLAAIIRAHRDLKDGTAQRLLDLFHLSRRDLAQSIRTPLATVQQYFGRRNIYPRPDLAVRIDAVLTMLKAEADAAGLDYSNALRDAVLTDPADDGEEALAR